MQRRHNDFDWRQTDSDALGNDRLHHCDFWATAKETAKLAHSGFHSVALAVNAQSFGIGIHFKEEVHALVGGVFVGTVDLETCFFIGCRHHFVEHGFEFGGLSVGGGELGNE